MGKDQDDDDYERSEHGLTLCHEACGKAHSMPGLLIDNAKSRMLLYRVPRSLRETCAKSGRVGCFIFASRACRAHLARLAHNSRRLLWI
jgi:hypothetical protein